MKTFWIILVSIVGTLLIVGGVSCLVARRAATSAMNATPVWVEHPLRGDLVETVSAPGIVEPKSKVSISARVSARILELPFKEGQAVTCGDPNANPPVPPSLLVKLDSQDLQADLRSARARRQATEATVAVMQAQIAASKERIIGAGASLKDAEKTLRRNRDLLETGDVAVSQVDTAQRAVDELHSALAAQEKSLAADILGLEVQRHNLEANDADISRAEQSVGYCTITSPMNGTLTKLNAEVGELVMTGTMNNAGTVILEVADLEDMLVVADVDESDVAKVALGQKVTARIQGYEDEKFTGVVESVALVHTLQRDGSKVFQVKIRLDTNGKRIYSGLTANVNIQTRCHECAIQVPSQAILGRRVDELPVEVRESPLVDKTKTRTSVVYRLVDGKAAATPVQTGPGDARYTTITGGLSENDLVIIGPYKVLEGINHGKLVKNDKSHVATTAPAATQSATASAPASGPASRPSSRPGSAPASPAASIPASTTAHAQ